MSIKGTAVVLALCGLLVLFLKAPTASAVTIAIGIGGGSTITIQDNVSPLDIIPGLGVIGWNQINGSGFTVGPGIVREQITTVTIGGIPTTYLAFLQLTGDPPFSNLVITNTGGGSASGTIVFQSAPFPAMDPLATSLISLDGFFENLAGPVGPLSSATLTGTVNGFAPVIGVFTAIPIPGVNPSPFTGEVLNQAPMVPPITSLEGTLNWVLSAPGDMLVLPHSAVVQAPIPEPATLALFGFGLAGLVVLRRRRREAP